MQAAGQIADLGGGALMAAFGILAALRERDGGGPGSASPGSGEGQLVDVSMADGALSWLAMVAAHVLRRRQRPAPRRSAAGRLADLLPRLRVRRRLGHARRARAEVLAGILPRRRARGADRGAVRAPGIGRTRAGEGDLQGAHARAVGGVRARARLLPGADARARRGARLASSWARARWSSRSTSPAPSAPCACSACRSSSTRTPGDHARLPGPALGEHTEQVLRAAGYSAQEVAELLAERAAAAGPPAPRRTSPSRCEGERPPHERHGEERPRRRPRPPGTGEPGVPRDRGLLKMSELAERSGVSAGTIRYYLREGLLGEGEEIVRTSRNMAYYPPEYVERIELIKRLQEKRFMPLRVIKGTLERGPRRVRALIELEDRILERTLAERRGLHARVARRRVRGALRDPAQRARAARRDRRADAQPQRLRPRRREDHRGDRELPRRRLRGGARLHRVRHAALPRGAGAAREGGGAGAAASAWPARSMWSARWRSSPPAPSRCAS